MHLIVLFDGTDMSSVVLESMEVSCLEQTPEEVSVDTTIASVLSELENISSLKEEQRMTLEAFLHGQDVFALLPTD